MKLDLGLVVITFPLWLSLTVWAKEYIPYYYKFKKTVCGKRGHLWLAQSNLFAGFDTGPYRTWEICERCGKRKD